MRNVYTISIRVNPGCPAILLYLLFPACLVSSYFSSFFVLVSHVLFQKSVHYCKSVCITCTFIKVNIFPLSPNLGHNMISFYKIYTLNQSGAVHNEVNVHRHGKLYLIDFMSRKCRILTDICNLYHLCYDQ